MNFKEILNLKEEMFLVEKYIIEYLPPEKRNEKVDQIIQELMLAKGKRLRPQILLLAGKMGPDYEKVKDRLCRLGALLELVHMASLVHDDIIDDSLLRRGLPTVQSKYGKDMAVYTGDLILSRVLQNLFKEKFQESGVLLGKTVEDMCMGELGQMACRYRMDVEIDEYMQNIYGKTVSMFELACRLGAMESRCDEETIKALCDLGKNMGYMFQIRDDLLDFLSNAQDEGKPTHADFQEGIYTLPVLYAMKNKEYESILLKLMLQAESSIFLPEHMEALDKAVIQSGGLSAAIDTMEKHRMLAEEALERLPEHSTKKMLHVLLKKLVLPELPFYYADRKGDQIIC